MFVADEVGKRLGDGDDGYVSLSGYIPLIVDNNSGPIASVPPMPPPPSDERILPLN